jgi:hypothetical protein
MVEAGWQRISFVGVSIGSKRADEKLLVAKSLSRVQAVEEEFWQTKF